ncbi:DNA processing protein [Parafrankia irregularis]|uniref:DNA processing protein n=2 Tax=Parafrankia TaxID=2994362 RepID=A0A0S4QZE6_9ACTN|nr:DNA-protecting protein DprA [Parafrankia sp. CH37]CUU61003.1 DNA processing protein [Parafrankia irregularis]
MIAPVPPSSSPNTTDVTDRLARAALSRILRPDDPHTIALVRRHGAAEIWERLRHDHPRLDPRRDLDEAERVGGRIICPGDNEWPASLLALDQVNHTGPQPAPGPPLALWVRGAESLSAARRAVAVVGARAATDYGKYLAGDLGVALAERKWCVISGAAFGIDAAAHRGSLAGGGPTFAVLAGGIDVPYPAAHAELLDEIAHRGALISEAPPGSPPYRRRLLARNRIITALARGTVIVEAGYRSGALNAARHARELSKPLMVFPGPVTSAMSAGCHRLLRDHPENTTLVTGVDDVLQALGLPRPSSQSTGPHARA